MVGQSGPQKSEVKTGSNLTASWWNVALALVYLLEGLVLLLVGHSNTIGVVTAFLTTDSIASQASNRTVFATATHHLFGLNLLVLVVLLLLVLALRPVLLLKQSAVWNRAGQLAAVFSSLLIVLIVSSLVGVRELSVFLLLIVLVTISALVKKASWARWLAASAPWLILALYLLGDAVYGVAASWYVYVTFVLGVIAIFVPRLLSLSDASQGLKFAKPTMYTLLGLVINSALAWTVFAGVLK